MRYRCRHIPSPSHDEEFDIAFGAGDGAFDNAVDCKKHDVAAFLRSVIQPQ